MFIVNFTSLRQAMDLNKRTEAEVVADLISFYKNQNYRADYNKNKNAVTKLLKDDPIVKKRMAELKAAVKK